MQLKGLDVDLLDLTDSGTSGGFDVDRFQCTGNFLNQLDVACSAELCLVPASTQLPRLRLDVVVSRVTLAMDTAQCIQLLHINNALATASQAHSTLTPTLTLTLTLTLHGRQVRSR